MFALLKASGATREGLNVPGADGGRGGGRGGVWVWWRGGLMYASVWPTSQIFGRTLIAGDDPREIALTFDDGPNDAATPELLEVLARHDVRATFFAMGSFARQRPEIVRAVVAAGHLLGNHTMSHPKLSMEPAARVRQELADCTAVLEDIDRGCGAVLSSAVWRAAAGGAADCARTGADSGDVERDGV